MSAVGITNGYIYSAFLQFETIKTHSLSSGSPYQYILIFYSKLSIAIHLKALFLKRE
jgi:hypothetical protein